jgi:hypothetical protein
VLNVVVQYHVSRHQRFFQPSASPQPLFPGAASICYTKFF